MKTNDEAVAQLRSEVEQRFGRELAGPHDFSELAEEIATVTTERLSMSTLKRLWGYVDGYDTVRPATLNTLSRYVGSGGWKEFCDSLHPKDPSDWGKPPVIAMSTLKTGDCVEVTWKPGRRMVAQYLGQGRLRVVESCRCKIVVGDTFSCAGMVCGEQLVLTQVEHIGCNEVLTYICGKHGGVQARKL